LDDDGQHIIAEKGNKTRWPRRTRIEFNIRYKTRTKLGKNGKKKP
jgi:hypothetical protein